MIEVIWLVRSWKGLPIRFERVWRSSVRSRFLSRDSSEWRWGQERSLEADPLGCVWSNDLHDQCRTRTSLRRRSSGCGRGWCLQEYRGSMQGDHFGGAQSADANRRQNLRRPISRLSETLPTPKRGFRCHQPMVLRDFSSMAQAQRAGIIFAGLISPGGECYLVILAPKGTSSLKRSIGSCATHAVPRSKRMRKSGSSNVQL